LLVVLDSPFQGLMAVASRTEAEGRWVEQRLEDRGQEAANHLLARIVHKGIEQRSGESVRRLEITQPNENTAHRFF
jgi:ribose 1,5-bisphosphokinase PhnN